jgi:serine/threonine protein kinase
LLERRIGHGAMAMVFSARRIDGNRAVAIKVMRPEIGYEDGVVERFHIEGEVMAQLDHPHIVHINARGEAGEILWFEMDLVEGSSLAAVLQRGPIPWRRAARIVAEAADALAYAHSRGVVHRDVKPANLLLMQPADSVVIGDFGIARIVGTRRLTATGLVVGTPSYMSPEQFYSVGEFAATADQYSLGAVAYEMITGTAPPSAVSSGGGASARRSPRRAPIRTLAPECPAPLAVLVGRMLAFRAEDRWPDLAVVSRLAREIAETGTATGLQRPGPGGRIVAMLRRIIE